MTIVPKGGNATGLDVPPSIPATRGWLALIELDLDEAVTSLVTTASSGTKAQRRLALEFKNEARWQRDWHVLAKIGNQLNWPAGQLDAVFQLAKNL